MQDDVDSIAKLYQIVALCQRLQIHTTARRIGTEKQAQPAEQRLEKREWSWINRGNDKIMNYEIKQISRLSQILQIIHDCV